MSWTLEEDSLKLCDAFCDSEANCVADPWETDISHIRTDISLHDSFSEVMENIQSKVLSNIQLDQTMSLLGCKSEPGVDKPLVLGIACPVTIDPEPKPGKDKQKCCNDSNSSISDASPCSPDLAKQTKKNPK